MKKIAIIATGGTIAVNAGDGNKANLSGLEMLQNSSQIKGIEIAEISFRQLYSPNITFADLFALREEIYKVTEQGFDGVVITHGTDTMEESAWFLEVTRNYTIPVVLTGAQRKITLAGADGAMNLLDAITVAADDMAKEMGVVIVFGGEIVAAREATKTHRHFVTTFKTYEFGALGTLANERIFWARKPIHDKNWPLEGITSKNFPLLRIPIIPAFLGADSSLLQCVLQKNESGKRADGIVIEGLGAGHVPSTMLEGIDLAIGQGIPVVLVSRVPAGRLFVDTYDYAGSEKDLLQRGVIWGEDLTAWKARIKLFVLLLAGLSLNEIRYELQESFYFNDAS